MPTRDGASLQERIVALIHERGLAPESPMPTEVQLMELLGTSRNSVREAVRALQALGIVEIRHGHGTFVGHASLEALTPSFAFRVRSGAGGIRALNDLVEVRELLETGLIGQVAQSTSAPRLAALEALANGMDRDREADRAFHALLYDSCGNELVLQLIGLFWDVYHEVEPTLGPPEERTAEIAVNHRRIVAALRARDPEAAREAMRLHFRDVKARIARAEARPEPART
ncbi:FadR/GntR family transcriptional regulator [Nonomuraea sp. NEAU-A123]|uniref:FadR/GntR family transcriptional regulator n=1 Tax=Nonomuraea sp. NEAU-A123 TaxID=2839649 RepID=UPI001BE449A1|nr:FadR/GntR family transcriptional regulator [Nonomuraea sp. NEAU-A123]MBT2230042.1 FadR family transcriptional regulator [Nonomuraea sp. NEAU-A123]MBT2230688.1 FadR family transcriptional regulator [Nonomuraea sp. NEAU-A123]